MVQPESGDTSAKCRYDLSPNELAALESELLLDLAELTGSAADLYCVWVDTSSKYADIVRTHETREWGYIPEIMQDKDESSDFLLVVDTRDPEAQGVKRVSRITFIKDEYIDRRMTGMAIVDDVLASRQGLAFGDFVEYYGEKGVDIKKCFSVETNKKIERAPRYNGLPLAEIGYLAMFHRIDGLREGGLAYIFAPINQQSIDSFNLIDLRPEPLAGRADIRTPAGDGEFDDEFVTVALPTTEHNLGIFEKIDSMSAPELRL